MCVRLLAVSRMVVTRVSFVKHGITRATFTAKGDPLSLKGLTVLNIVAGKNNVDFSVR